MDIGDLAGKVTQKIKETLVSFKSTETDDYNVVLKNLDQHSNQPPVICIPRTLAKVNITQAVADEYQDNEITVEDYFQLLEEGKVDEGSRLQLEAVSLYQAPNETMFDWINYTWPSASTMKHAPNDYQSRETRENAFVRIVNGHELLQPIPKRRTENP